MSYHIPFIGGSPLKLESTVQDGILVVRPEGDITLGNAGEVNDYVLRRMHEAPGKRLIFNLGKVDYLDSSAIGMIVAIFSEVQGEGGALRLCAAKDDVMETFRASSLDSVLPIDADEAAALAAIRG